MTEKARVEGSCLCGATRFEVALPTLYCAHCHCTMCQRNHGAAFVTWFTVPLAQLELLDGGDRIVRYASSDHGTRSFCGSCGSSLFCESTRHPERIDIVLANMEGPIDREPQMHIYYSDRVTWAEAKDSLPRLGGSSGMEPVDDPEPGAKHGR